MLGALVGSSAGGMALAALGLIIRKKRHHWFKIRAIIFAAAGFGGVVIFAWALGLGVQGVQAILYAISHAVAAKSPQAANALSVVADGIPWSIGVLITAWWVFDIWPRHGDADDHTGWIGLFVPAAWALLPPLATLLAIG